MGQQQDAVRRLEKELATAPDPGAIMMLLAVHQARGGNTEAALRWLEKAADLRQGFAPLSPGFAGLKENPRFQQIMGRIGRDNPAIARGRVAFTAPMKLVTEGLAANPATGDLYIGSLNDHKVLRVTRNGRWSDFTGARQDGLDEPLGMKVDQAGRSLWVVNNSASEHGVLQFDLRSARLTRKWTLAGNPKEHLLNDLTITPEGEAWVTDSRAGAVYRAGREGDKLMRFDLGRQFPGANGIAMAADGRRIYLACFPEGIVVLDPGNKTAVAMRRPAGMTLAAIDGLYLHQGRLIGVQNTLVIYRVAAWTLNTAGDAVEKEEILERSSKYLKDPTTGVFLRGIFHFIANSELDHWKDGKLSAVDGMQPVRILALR